MTNNLPTEPASLYSVEFTPFKKQTKNILFPLKLQTFLFHSVLNCLKNTFLIKLFFHLSLSSSPFLSLFFSLFFSLSLFLALSFINMCLSNRCHLMLPSLRFCLIIFAHLHFHRTFSTSIFCCYQISVNLVIALFHLNISNLSDLIDWIFPIIFNIQLMIFWRVSTFNQLSSQTYIRLCSTLSSFSIIY